MIYNTWSMIQNMPCIAKYIGFIELLSGIILGFSSNSLKSVHCRENCMARYSAKTTTAKRKYELHLYLFKTKSIG